MATEIQRILVKYETDVKAVVAGAEKIIDANEGIVDSEKDVAKEGKKAFSGLQKELKDTEKPINGLLGSIKAIGGAIAAAFTVREVIQFTTESVKLADIQLKAEGQLLKALNGREDVQQRLLKAAAELQKQTIFGDEVIIQQQAFLASLGFSEEKINDVIAASADLSAATGLTLEGSVRNLAKTYSGLSGELGELIPQLRGLTAEQLQNGEGVKVVTELFEGQAKVLAQIGTGPLIQLQNAFGDLRENLGKLILSSGGFNSLLDGFRNAIGFLDRITPKTGQYSQELAGQRDEINVLTRQILLANEGEEQRSKLITELTTKYPDFLAGLNAEYVSNEQLATRLKEVNAEYVKRITLAIKSEDLEAQQQKTAAILVKSEDRRVTLIEKLAEAQRKFNLELDPTQDLATQVEQAIAGLTSQSNDLGVALNPALRAINGLEKAFLNLRVSEADFARETLESETLAGEIYKLAERLGISLEQATQGVQSGALKLGGDIGAAVVRGAADKVKDDGTAAIILELQKQLELTEFRLKFGVDPEGIDLIGDLVPIEPIRAAGTEIDNLEEKIIENGKRRDRERRRRQQQDQQDAEALAESNQFFFDTFSASIQGIQQLSQATSNARIDSIQAEIEAGRLSEEAGRAQLNREAQRQANFTAFFVQLQQFQAIAQAIASRAKLPILIPLIVGSIVGFFSRFIGQTPQSPGFAKGTSFGPGTDAIVGEKGPERMFVPRGARIFTAEATKKERSLIDALNAGKHEQFIHDHYLKPFAAQLQGGQSGWSYDDFQLRQAVRSNKVIELGPKTLRKITKANKPTYH